MTISVEAIYEGGVLRPLWPLDLAEGTKIAILLEQLSDQCADLFFVAERRLILEDE